MARPAAGWRLRKPRPGERTRYVRFSHGGKQHELSTGHWEREAAAHAAADLYAQVVSGKYIAAAKTARPKVGGRLIGQVAADWLSATDAERDERTSATYAGYFSAQLGSFFETIEAVTTERAQEYIRHRLRSVKAGTIRKELSALRGLLAWAYADRAPIIPSVPKKLQGTAHAMGKRTRTALTPAEAQAVIAKLPEWSRSREVKGEATPLRWPIRARFVVAYETSLRPATLDALSVPEHYEKGATHLRIPEEDDKARHGRSVPLSAEARRALDSVAPKAGLIFGSHDYRDALEKAAAAVLPAGKAATFHAYDLRRARITHWLEDTGNLPGTQWLAGHKHMSTTAKYVEASLRAAEDVLRSAGQNRPSSRGDSRGSKRRSGAKGGT